MLMSTRSSLNISISIRKKLMLMLMSQLSSLVHKLMLMFNGAYACVASEDRALILGIILM